MIYVIFNRSKILIQMLTEKSECYQDRFQGLNNPAPQGLDYLNVKMRVFIVLIMTFFPVLTFAAVEDDQLIVQQDIFTIIWYFAVFCAWGMGFSRGQQR